MSQHKLLTNTRKKLTYLAVALSLASAQIAAYGAVSALGTAPADNSRAHRDVAALSDSSANGQGSPDQAASNDPASDTSGPGQNWHGAMGGAQGHMQSDGNPKKMSDGGPTPTPPPTPKEEQHPQPQPVTNNNNENNTNVTVKPADVHQVVNQETNVTVQQEQSQQQVVKQVVQPTRVIERRTVVAASTTTRPTTTMPTTQSQAQVQSQTPVVSGGKGALQETGFSAKPATLAGLGILGALGALSVVTRRKDFARG